MMPTTMYGIFPCKQRMKTVLFFIGITNFLIFSLMNSFYYKVKIVKCNGKNSKSLYFTLLRFVGSVENLGEVGKKLEQSFNGIGFAFISA